MNLYITLLVILCVLQSLFVTMLFKPSKKRLGLIRIFQEKFFEPICFFLSKIGIKSYILTMMNLFFGLSSTYFLYIGNYYLFIIFLLLAGFFDSFDGLMARLTNTKSKFWEKMDFFFDSSIRFFVLLTFWLIHNISILLYTLPFLLASIIIFGMKRDDIEFKKLFGYFNNPVSFLSPAVFVVALFIPYEMLTAISISLLINFLAVILSLIFN